MPTAILLNIDDPLYDFQHAMSHRLYYAIMSPLTRFSVMPYFITPMPGAMPPATNWRLNHQRAHNDFANHVPADFSASRFGIPAWANLVDTDLNDPGEREWFTFANFQEHYIADGTMQPFPTASALTPSTQPPPWWIRTSGAKFPFW